MGLKHRVFPIIPLSLSIALVALGVFVHDCNGPVAIIPYQRKGEVVSFNVFPIDESVVVGVVGRNDHQLVQHQSVQPLIIRIVGE